MMKYEDFMDSVPPRDYVVCLRYKYPWESEYTETTEFLEYDGNSDTHIWLNDWNEGQTDIYVTAAVPFDHIDHEFLDNALIM